ncbi:hypothetical protein EVAR_44075_1 [Eumeta japonica]|uniref:Uncharacterized protein n=1 Tax=Eumeta variegata TaxID=151549 RepID=A0A4C1X0H9_EUMVA|nr:hypothetical protein EVAR_44075_1 [Eumeta japonica]
MLLKQRKQRAADRGGITSAAGSAPAAAESLRRHRPTDAIITQTGARGRNDCVKTARRRFMKFAKSPFNWAPVDYGGAGRSRRPPNVIPLGGCAEFYQRSRNRDEYICALKSESPEGFYGNQIRTGLSEVAHEVRIGSGRGCAGAPAGRRRRPALTDGGSGSLIAARPASPP